MNATDRAIGRRLAQAREARNLTQETVAKAMGLHGPDISRIEHGKKRILAAHIVSFSQLYDVEVSWLFGEDPTLARIEEKVDALLKGSQVPPSRMRVMGVG